VRAWPSSRALTSIIGPGMLALHPPPHQGLRGPLTCGFGPFQAISSPRATTRSSHIPAQAAVRISFLNRVSQVRFPGLGVR
jgi:hypothetical protein